MFSPAEPANSMSAKEMLLVLGVPWLLTVIELQALAAPGVFVCRMRAGLVRPGRVLTVGVRVPVRTAVLGEQVKRGVQLGATPVTRTDGGRIAYDTPAGSTVLAIACGYPCTSARVEVMASLSGISAAPV